MKKSYLDYEIKLIKYGDKAYPKSLRQIKNPPKQLYVQGNLSPEMLEKAISIVGSRRVTRYGEHCIDKFVTDFVTEGVTTISGFMYGVDTLVHQKTLDYGGKTIAVFGNGLNYLYPSENEALYTAILENGGATLSEYKPGSKPQLWKYPQRNRIVSGLSSLGVLVVEAAIKSGSLITAELAIEQNKKLFALPGPITSSVSQGTNELIKAGKAKLITCSSDILGQVKKENKPETVNLDNQEKAVFQALSREPLSLDELSAVLETTVVELSSTISILALKGLISESAGKFYLV